MKSHKTINPIELLLLGAFSFIFVNSVLGLVKGYGLQVKIAPPLAESQNSSDGQRQPAALQASFTTLELNCSNPLNTRVQAEKIRLTGNICGSETYQQHLKTEVLNMNNNIQGTAFTHPNQTFLTDYLPLEKGENQIMIKFYFESGKSTAQKLSITRQ